MPHSTFTLFDPVRVGDMSLANRVVMAPLTRNRAPDAIPTPLMAQYYAQRASAGLLITEATAISHQGQGYADVPGLYGTEQIDGWKQVTKSVHAVGGKIVVQLWPCVPYQLAAQWGQAGRAFGHYRQNKNRADSGRCTQFC